MAYSRWNRLWWITLAAGLLTACTPSRGTALPPRPSTPVMSSATPSLSAKEAAIQAYTEFTVAADQAAKVSDDQAHELLARYAEGKYLAGHLKAIRGLRAEGKEPWGGVVIHITKTTVDKDTAVVEDCQDQSRAGVAYRDSHELIPHTTGDRRVSLVSTLNRGKDGHWRLFNLVQLDAPCTPGSSSS